MRIIGFLTVCLLIGWGWNLQAKEKPERATEKEQELRQRMAMKLDAPIDLQRIKDELQTETQTFEEKGVVSVEGGAACLDAEGTQSEAAQMDNTMPQIDPSRAVLKVRIVIPDVNR